jgi:cyclic pyranopterin phosphate synthase
MSDSRPVAVTIARSAPAGRLEMAEPRLVDTFGRVATDLRVSLTDRCNLRCTYCMPAEGMTWLPRREVLTDDEVSRLVRIAVERLGVTDIRFTGGEPLLRPGLKNILAATTSLAPQPSVSLTTNGIGLAERAAALAASGLRRINVSLDTLQPDRFQTLSRRDRLDEVLHGLHAARRAGLRPVKVNTVLMRGVNDDEAVALLDFCLDNGFELRFIEQMPLDADHIWRRENMITAAEILERLSTRFVLTPVGGPRGSAPAERWLVDGGPVTVGIIASVTRSFCSTCDRTRLTADGQVRTCLFAQQETNLRDALRAGADDEQLADLWRVAMWGKAAGHTVNAAGFVQPLRPMSAIGG